MTVRSFAGTLAFGIAAGIGFPGFAVLSSPLVGTHTALWLWIALGAIAYSALLGRGWRERITGAFIATLFLIPTAFLTIGRPMNWVSTPTRRCCMDTSRAAPNGSGT